MEEGCQLLRKMRLRCGAEDHLQLVFMRIEKAAQDDLLSQRRKGIGDRRVQLLKNAVGEAREAAHRHIDEAGTGEGLGE